MEPSRHAAALRRPQQGITIVTAGLGKQRAKSRVFLFLQGPSSSLYRRMAKRLEAEGASCLRVNLNAGDWIFWRRSGGLNYRGSFTDWAEYVRRLIAERGVTDLIVPGEERP